MTNTLCPIGEHNPCMTGAVPTMPLLCSRLHREANMKFKKKCPTVDATYNDNPAEILRWINLFDDQIDAEVCGGRVIITLKDSVIHVLKNRWLVIDGDKIETYTEESFVEHFERLTE